MQIRLYLTNVQRIRNKTYIYIYPILVTLILHIHAINAKFPKEIPLNLYPILNYSLSSDNETSTRTTSSRNIHDLILSRLDSGVCGITSKLNYQRAQEVENIVVGMIVPWLTPTRNRRDRSFLRNRPRYRQFLRNLAKLLNERELGGTLPDGERPRPRSFLLGRAYLLVA